MKKTYKKPEIVFESFKLSSSIATTCSEVISADINTCEKEFGWDIFFGAENGACTTIDAMDCYHVPGKQFPGLFGS
jgi:hypothetical protein